MGYFKKQLRRHKARKEVTEFATPLLGVDQEAWSALPESPQSIRGKYVRFRIDLGTDTASYFGLFSGASEIKEHIETPEPIRKAMRKELRWFGRQLPTPKDVDQGGVFWFVWNNSEMIDHAWNLSRLAKEAGAVVLIEDTNSPGRIVYRDQYQVAAIRFKDAKRISEATRAL